MKIVTFDEIKALGITPFQCFAWVDEMLKNKAQSILPPKISLHLPDDAFCNVMPCVIDMDQHGKIGGVKIVNRYLDREPSLDSRLLLINMDNGEFLALMDANWITAMRTGAVAVHSINLLAKKDFETVAIMGLGNTARATLLILAEKYKDKDLNIKLLKYKGQEQLFVERFSEYKNLHFSYVDNVELLVKKSDVVISCVTYTENDFCSDDCFEEGVLVVPVHTRGFTNCDLFFDKVYADDKGHVCHFKNFDKFNFFAEVSDVVNESAPGRENDRERILAYNIGLSIHDINYAAHIYEMIGKNEDLLNIEMNTPKEKFWI